MSALYAARVEAEIGPRAYVVAGDLHVGGRRVFGADAEPDWQRTFHESDNSWNGHCWLTVGKWVVEPSLLRTACSPRSPEALRLHVANSMRAKRGLLIWTDDAAKREGVEYVPRYVLTREQVTALAGGAWSLLTSHAAPGER
jgi:hypothetical protein